MYVEFRYLRVRCNKSCHLKWLFIPKMLPYKILSLLCTIVSINKME